MALSLSSPPPTAIRPEAWAANLPSGPDNQAGSAGLDDNGHLQPSSANATDRGANGPVFDLMGTRRPIAHSTSTTPCDRGAIEEPN